jgi:DNA replicative helicase MCM subunit Mcm2 (Cdc46/Mcm family)
MEREEVVERFAEFLEEVYRKELAEVSLRREKSLDIDFQKLDRFDIDLADLLLEEPEETLPLFEEAAKQVEPDLVESFRIRFFNLPEGRQIRIRNLRAEHIGKLITVDGIVVRASEVRPEVSEIVFQCLDCGAEITVLQTTRTIKKPDRCEKCGNRKNFTQVRQTLFDARWVVIEEPFEIVEAERPSSLMVYLKEDLVSPRMRSKTDPGNRIEITGILKEIPRRLRGTRSRQMEIYIEANHIEPLEIEWEELEITPEDEKKIIELAKSPDVYEKLVKSIAPGIYGLDHLKEAIALQLFGGVPKILPDKSRIRGDMHILLVGDPSCLVAGTKVWMADGSLKNIEEFGTEHLEKINEQVMLESGNVATAKVFHRYEFFQVMGLLTEDGKNIKGTFNQPVLTRNGWKRLDELKLGEEIKVVERKGGKLKERWEKIVEISYELPQTVYDIEVPVHKRFIANGIIVHNTAKSQIMKTVAQLIPRGRYVSGKGVSVDYDDPIIYKENGMIKTDLIGEFCDKFYDKDGNGFVKVKNVEVPVFDRNTFKITWKPLTAIYRHKVNEKILKLVLRTGREVRVTADHSVFTIDGCKVKEVKADELRVGDYILIPAKIPVTEKFVEEIDLWKEFKKIGVKQIKLKNDFIYTPWTKYSIPRKIKINKKFAKLLGLFIADGYCVKSGQSWRVVVILNKKEKKLIEWVKQAFEEMFNAKATLQEKGNAVVVCVHSKLVYLFFKEVLKIGKAREKKVPDIVFNIKPNLQLEFIKGYILGDYGVTASKKLASDILYLLLLNRKIGGINRRHIKRTIQFPDHEVNVDGEFYQLKSPKPKKILKNNFELTDLHKRIPLKPFTLPICSSLRKSKYQRLSSSALERFYSKFRKKFYQRLKLLNNGITSKQIAKIYGINHKSASQYLNKLVKMGIAEKVNGTYKLTEKGLSALKELELIEKLLQSDLAFVKIQKIEKVDPSSKYVYDLCVDGYENFVAGFGGVFCHNTGVGLTASVTRDEEFFGGWVLEAGALVLCNKSLLAIDEFEKIERGDQIALHEAMEQQTISIAKANIVATLPAQTAILAGGNPKLGRFDPYLPIKEQIDVPETLLARFDLKFALRDRPNPEIDEKIADYILQTRHFQAELAKPAVPPSLLRKYIAYARKNCQPKLSRKAGEKIKEFFVNLRAKAMEEEAPIPITLRQYEALIRLAEASARVRLSDVVIEEDALRAIKLMKISLREFGFEPETGQFDIDRAEGLRTTAAQRSKIRIILDIIDELTKAQGAEVDRSEIITKAREMGVDNADEILTKMLREGIVYSPRVNKISKV